MVSELTTEMPWDADVDLVPLPDGWQYRPLRDLVEGGRSISYGIVQPGRHSLDGVPIVRAEAVKRGRVVEPEPLRVSRQIEAKYTRTRLLGGEVLVTLVGAYFGEVGIAPPIMAGWNVARAVAVVPVDRRDAKFVAYALQSPLCRHFMQVWATTTAQPTLNLAELQQIPVPWPPQPERDEIVRILATLDAQNDLNRQMGQTLEDLARAIFTSWFVDFDPVVTKAAGRMPIGMSAEVSELFSKGFQKSELGPIPHGWRTGVVGDLIAQSRVSVSPSLFPTEVFDHFSIPAFDDGQQPKKELGGSIKSNKFIVSNDCVLLSKLNPQTPRIWLPDVGKHRAICSTEFMVMSAKPHVSREFMWGLFSSRSFADDFATLVTGTSNSHQRVKPDDFLSMKIAIPPPPVVAAYASLNAPLLKRRTHLLRQIRTLESLSEITLPRLMTGELQVKKAESLFMAKA